MSESGEVSVPQVPQGQETTGRYIVTFQDDALKEGVAALHKMSGLKKLVNVADLKGSREEMAALDGAPGAIFPTLGVAVVSLKEDALDSLSAAAGEGSPIQSIEPEYIFYALQSGLTSDYLSGYKDAVNALHSRAARTNFEEEEEAEVAVTYVDDSQSTWGLKPTRVVNSRFTGRGIKVAILDTGLDLRHPDFRGRAITARSFVSGQTPQDGHGHGTHCTGTACGSKNNTGRRYGIASQSSIFIGKVLSNAGSGASAGILAGMEWAINSGCQVISMSLGNTVPTSSPAYEAVGRRALAKGSLIVAAAGNWRQYGLTVGQPANSPSIMAVGAIDNQIKLAPFSCRSGSTPGANVDIAGPGVAVYSAAPMPRRYATMSGTSMATPHVAGIAALWAESSGARGFRLWQSLTSRARRLAIPAADVGSGLVQAPA